MLKIFAVVALLVVAATALSIKEDLAAWTKFKADFGKQYEAAEEKERFAVFQSNLRLVDDLNANMAPEGQQPYGVTKFMDMSPEEFRAAGYLMRRGAMTPMYEGCDMPDCNQSVVAPFQAQTLPDSFSWVGKATSPVKNQLQCGSCWAFSATEQIESMSAIQRNLSTVPVLSVQDIVSCDRMDGVMGCDGGFSQGAYDWVVAKGGLEDESDYPYTGVDGTCKFSANKINPDSAIETWSYVADQGGRNETQLKYYTALEGPISICIDASTWQFYFGGIVRFFCSSNPDYIDHCVQLTGYNMNGDFDTPYWEIRNSWGSWGESVNGESGFIFVEMGKDLCSIGDCATTTFAKM